MMSIDPSTILVLEEIEFERAHLAGVANEIAIALQAGDLTATAWRSFTDTIDRVCDQQLDEITAHRWFDDAISSFRSEALDGLYSISDADEYIRAIHLLDGGITLSLAKLVLLENLGGGCLIFPRQYETWREIEIRLSLDSFISVTISFSPPPFSPPDAVGGLSKLSVLMTRYGAVCASRARDECIVMFEPEDEENAVLLKCAA